MRSHFDYHRPESVEAATQLKQALGDSAIYWAGGTDLVLKWKRELIHPQHCIDLTAIDGLNYIDTAHPDAVRIGGLTTLADIERADGADPHLQTLAGVARIMDTVQTRTIATIGGNLCNASPAADLIPTLIVMGASLQTIGPDGAREFAVEELMCGPGKTTLLDGEIVTEIHIPTDTRRRASSYRRIDRTVVDIALVSAAAAITLDDSDAIVDARVALGAVAPTVIRSDGAESALKGKAISELNDELRRAAGDAATQDAAPIDDVRASAEYRSAMVKVLVRRVLEDVVRSLCGEGR
jgi:carbon-monoxide dehydrogenase medium subunit